MACTASEEDMSSNNIELKWVRGRKLYSRSGDFVEFKCRRGHVKDPASSSPFRVECVEGMLEYPRCKPGGKSSALQPQRGCCVVGEAQGKVFSFPGEEPGVGA